MKIILSVLVYSAISDLRIEQFQPKTHGEELNRTTKVSAPSEVDLTVPDGNSPFVKYSLLFPYIDAVVIDPAEPSIVLYNDGTGIMLAVSS